MSLGAEKDVTAELWVWLEDRESTDSLTMLEGADPELNFAYMLELDTQTDVTAELLPTETLSDTKMLPMLRPSTVIVNEADVGMNG